MVFFTFRSARRAGRHRAPARFAARREVSTRLAHTMSLRHPPTTAKAAASFAARESAVGTTRPRRPPASRSAYWGISTFLGCSSCLSCPAKSTQSRAAVCEHRGRRAPEGCQRDRCRRGLLQPQAKFTTCAILGDVVTREPAFCFGCGGSLASSAGAPDDASSPAARPRARW